MADVYEIARAGLELAEKATPTPWTFSVFSSLEEAKEYGNFEWCSVRYSAFDGREVGCVWRDVSVVGDGTSITGLPGCVETDADTARMIAHAGTHYAALCRALLAQKAVVEAAVAYVGLLDVIRSIDGEQDGSDAAWQALHDAEERGDKLWTALCAAVRAMKEQTR